MEDLIPPEQKLFRLDQIADMLQVHVKTVQRYAREGLLQVSLELPGKNLVSRANLLKFLERHAATDRNSA